MMTESIIKNKKKIWQTLKAEYLAALREKQRATFNRKDPTTVKFPRVGDVLQIGDSTS